MRTRDEIAKRLLTSRATVRELERLSAGRTSHAHPLESARLVVYRAAAQALAWALEIDLNQTDIPSSLLSLEEQPAHVQLHRLELGEPPYTLTMWLVEIPAHNDVGGPDYSTESWSCFLHDEQARQLLAALSTALPAATAPTRLPPLRAASASPSAAVRMSGRTLTVMSAPPEPDCEGGYADYAGAARLPDSAFGDPFARGEEGEYDQDEDDDDEDDEPPAASAPSLWPTRPLGA